MSKFDTHGGYFAPKDYMKVNEGGSHEENPNGGVQIGVDPEGTPNLLEEGEPVYKDYVYSDNITAEEKFLEENHIPKKYAGKLYSKIADDLFSEAEERPMDPISRNGLDVMLGRLADAQEGQKKAKEQADLEAELANLSPEELDQLEAMLAQGGENLGEAPGVTGAPEQMGPAEPVQQEPMIGQGMMQPIPGMGCGGRMSRRYDDGGDIPPVVDGKDLEILQPQTTINELGNALETSLDKYHSVMPPSLLTLGAHEGVKAYNDWVDNSRLGKVVSSLFPASAEEAFAPLGRVGKTAKTAWTAAEVETQIAKYAKEVEEAQRAYDVASKTLSTGLDEAGNAVAKDVAKTAVENARKTLRLVKREFNRWSGRRAPVSSAKPATEIATEATEEVGKKKGFLKTAAITGGVATGASLGYNLGKKYIYDPLKDIHSNRTGNYVESDQAPLDTIDLGGDFDLSFLDEEPEYKALGGPVNRFDFGDFLRRVQSYTPSTYRGGISGTYAIDNAFDLGKYKSIDDLEQSEAYDAFTKYVMRNSNDPNVRAYLQALDKGTNQDNGVPLLFDTNGNLVENWKDLYYQRRYDKTPGIYHLNPEEIYMMGPDEPWQQWGPGDDTKAPYHGANVNDWYAARAWNTMGLVNPSAAMAARTLAQNSRGQLAGYPSPDGTFIAEPGGRNSGKQGPGAGQDVNPEGAGLSPSLLPTWPRYAGAVGSGLLGLYNAFQEPDRYINRRMPVYTPEGRIHLQNQVYNPIDQNMIANAQIAQGNATQRALRNSGLGPSIAASVLAADNNLTGNLGTGFIQAWDANNQRKNAVIAANNQAEGQRAQFDANMDYYRTAALNNAAYRNAQNDLTIQRLNNQAESEKYAALSNQISLGLQSLSNIGKENFAMNQINTNPYFIGYGASPDGTYWYNPFTGRRELVPARQAVVSQQKAPENPKFVPPAIKAPTLNLSPEQYPLTLYGTSNPKYSTDPFMGYNNWTLKGKKKS